jgi:MFS family permease
VPADALIDRLPRRQLLIAADPVRAGALATIPAAGILADLVGLRPVLWAGAIGVTLSSLWLLALPRVDYPGPGSDDDARRISDVRA